MLVTIGHDYTFTIDDSRYFSYSEQNFSIQTEKKHLTKFIQTENYLFIFDGILYNNQELIKSLNLPLNTPLAKLLEIAFTKWDTQLFSKLDGIYTLFIYDKEQHRVYTVRDKVGINNLYYYHTKKVLIISDSLTTLVNHPATNKVLDKESLGLYLNLGYVLQPNTIYKNCHKIQSGHFIDYLIQKNKLYHRVYWQYTQLYNQTKTKDTEEHILKNIESILEQSIQKRLNHNMTYGAFLSGGYDSATIAALLQKASPHKIKTFTIGFNDQSINEAQEAKEIANYLGTEHIECYFTKENIEEIIPLLSSIYEEPFSDFGATPTILLAKIAQQQGVQTLFGGDGGDEVFATADSVELYNNILRCPYTVRNNLSKLIKAFTTNNFLPLPQNGLVTKSSKLVQLLSSQTITTMIKTKMTLFTQHELNQLLTYPYKFKHTVFDDIIFPPETESIDQVTGTFFQTFMVEGELQKVKSALDHYQIGIETPYLDLGLIQYLATIPTSLKVKNHIKKSLLKEIAHTYIPKKLLDRPKSGFAIPFDQWMRKELKELLIDTINESSIKRDGLFTQTLITLRDDFFNGREENKYKLWSIFLYQLWFDKNLRD
ncbi:MAG: hypothetical protein K0U47_05045 [Epsilonproteobacteria bacterium]|nr:hypothetical protein [Campylobacterota bacterium]